MKSVALLLFSISFIKTMLKILSVEIYAITEWVLMVYQVIMNEMCLMHSLFLNVQMSIISNTVFGIAYKKLF